MATERKPMLKENVFEGAYKDGKPNGHGKITYPDGRFYEGEFKDGKRNGHGKIIYFLMEDLMKANSKMACRMATERRPILMEASLKANQRWHGAWPRKGNLS